MNFPIHPDRLRIDANLRGWSEFCREVTPERLPKTILHVCQAVYEAIAPGRPCIAIKRTVLRRVAAGDCSGAVSAMLPAGFEARFESLPQGKSPGGAGSHRIAYPRRRRRHGARCGAARLPDRISLTADPVRRVQLFGWNLSDSLLPDQPVPVERS